MKWEKCKWGVKVFCCLLFAITNVKPSMAQDLFDYEHSKQYADFLYKDGQYPLAEQEYMRVVYFQPDDTVSWEKLIRSAQYQHQFETSLRHIDLYKSRVGTIPGLLRVAQLYTLLHLNDFPQVSAVLYQSTDVLSSDEILYFQSVSYALQNQWNQMDVMTKTAHEGVNFIRETRISYLLVGKKSPLLAGTLSAVIPGLGKVYTKRWKDGLFSLLLFSASAWQSYRGFDKYGVNSVFGWTFGAFAAGVYAGNIYGSVKSAHTYNEKVYHDHAEKVSNHLDGYYHWK